jgi:hypothetical protein
MTTVGPHDFQPLRRWDLLGSGRCAACYCPKEWHPIRRWVTARPLGDRSPALRSAGRRS